MAISSKIGCTSQAPNDWVNKPEVNSGRRANGAFNTVIGDLGVDAKGDIAHPDYVMHTWKIGDDGKYAFFQQK